MPELNECKFCKSMGFGGCEMCTDSRSERDRLKSELERVKRKNDALKAFVLMEHGKSKLDKLMDCVKQEAPE